MSLFAKNSQPGLSIKSKLAILPKVLAAGLAAGAGIIAVRAAIKTKAETGSIKALPFVKNLASQIFKTTKAKPIVS